MGCNPPQILLATIVVAQNVRPPMGKERKAKGRMKTHERNVLVWLVARPKRVAILTSILFLLAAVGCAPDMLTSPSEYNAKQLQAEAFAHCFAAELGWTVKVHFTDEHRQVDGNDCAGWATCPGQDIWIWNGWLLGSERYPPAPREWMRDIAAHEVCHSTGLCTHEDPWFNCYSTLINSNKCL